MKGKNVQAVGPMYAKVHRRENMAQAELHMIQCGWRIKGERGWGRRDKDGWGN